MSDSACQWLAQVEKPLADSVNIPAVPSSLEVVLLALMEDSALLSLSLSETEVAKGPFENEPKWVSLSSIWKGALAVQPR